MAGVLAILQARMGSSRLPGKMLLPIFDSKGPLELMLARLSAAKRLDGLLVATTTDASDDPLAALCQRLNTPCYRGSVNDVLDRFYQTALTLGPPATVVRLTGDCPLHDPAVVDLVVANFQNSGCDYCSNTNPPTYPDGLDAEVFSFHALETAWREARLPSEREHVTPFIRNHPERFTASNVAHATDLSHLRWTLDEQRDLALIRAIYQQMGRLHFTMQETVALLQQMPELTMLNVGIQRNEGYLKSLQADASHGNHPETFPPAAAREAARPPVGQRRPS